VKSLFDLPFDLKYRYPARNSAKVSRSIFCRIELVNFKKYGDAERFCISATSELVTFNAHPIKFQTNIHDFPKKEESWLRISAISSADKSARLEM
jgi:hypothetical protein